MYTQWCVAESSRSVSVPFKVEDSTGVVPLRSKPDIDTLGRSARHETESRLHTLLLTAVATGLSGKEALYVLLELHKEDREVNERTVMLVRVSERTDTCGKRVCVC